jgi:hypothetical protein
MTQAVSVRREGDIFQARMFWRKAACLLDPDCPIIKVGFEHGPKSFDDLWVEYDPVRCLQDQHGHPLRREHIQCKWHVRPDTYGHTNLIDPEFINAEKHSLLQKARQAQLAYAPDGIGSRFRLLTNWRVADPLRKLIIQRSSTLRLDDLFATKTDRSETGQIRKAWCDHLEIGEDELRLFLRTLALSESVDSLESVQDSLNDLFRGVGLRCVYGDQVAFPYDEIVFNWMAQGRQEFDRASFRDACAQECLLQSRHGRPIVYGAKSFEHPIDQLSDRCVEVLNFVPNFNERLIRDDADWSATLYPALRSFLLSAAKKSNNLRLALDAHITLAFAAGSVLDVKSGCEIELEQRTCGRKIWKAGDSTLEPSWANWFFEREELSANGVGQVVIVSLTHDIEVDVRRYLAASLPDAARMLVARPSTGVGRWSVASGQHAMTLAETLAQRITAEQKAGRQPIHLFIAGPNAFTFFLGQYQPGLGKTTLYEFDFEGFHGGSYTASLMLPITL